MQQQFEFKFSNWVVVELGAIRMGYAYFDGVEFARCPAIISKKEWNNGNPDPKLIRSIDENQIDSLRFMAMEKLGYFKEPI